MQLLDLARVILKEVFDKIGKGGYTSSYHLSSCVAEAESGATLAALIFRGKSLQPSASTLFRALGIAYPLSLLDDDLLRVASEDVFNSTSVYAEKSSAELNDRLAYLANNAAVSVSMSPFDMSSTRAAIAALSIALSIDANYSSALHNAAQVLYWQLKGNEFSFRKALRHLHRNAFYEVFM